MASIDRSLLISDDGKLLVDADGTLADPACCCAPTGPCADCKLPLKDPDTLADCPHSVCFELKLDEADTSDQDFFDLGRPASSPTAGDASPRMGVWFDGESWQVYAQSDSVSLPAVNPRDWQKFKFTFEKQEDGGGDKSVLCKWSVNGVNGPDFNFADPGTDDAVVYGAQFGAQNGSGAKHRSIRNICFVNFSGGLFQFSFPPDSFYNLEGSASIDGNGSLRIDSEAVEDDFGNIYGQEDMVCCSCGPEGAPFWRDCSEISAFDLTYDFDVSSSDDPGHDTGCPAFASSGSHTFHFDRINWADAFDDALLQFKLYVARPVDNCQLIMQSDHFYPVGIRHDFPIDDGVCSIILDRIVTAGLSDNECGTGGTFSFGGDPDSVSSEKCLCSDDGGVAFIDCLTCGGDAGDACSEGFTSSRCGGASCGAFPNIDPSTFVYASGLPWTPADASGIKGTYTTSNTCTSDDGNRSTEMTVTVTLVIS